MSILRAIQRATLLVSVLLPFQGRAAEPVIAGLGASSLTAELKGQILVEEMNCVACHQSEGTLPARSKVSPRLGEIGARLNPAFVKSFILDPHGSKPGTTMPDVLSQLPAAEKAAAAEALTHFLFSQKPANFAPDAPDLIAAAAGHKLFHSRGCAACHSPRDERGVELPMANSVPLSSLEGKYSQKSLTAFLRQPHNSRPSGRMPDLKLQARDIEQIAHFLLQKTQVPGGLRYTLYKGQVWEGLKSENVKPEYGGQIPDFDIARFGKLQQHSALVYEGWLNAPVDGAYTFYATMNGGSLTVDGKEIVQQSPSDRRGVVEIKGVANLSAGSHSIQLTYFHTGRQPRLEFTMEAPGKARGHIPGNLLSVTKVPVAPYQPLKVDDTLAEKGRGYFSRLGCANCHNDVKSQGFTTAPLAKLDASRGCLSETHGAWPRFELSPAQRALIRQALPSVAEPKLTDTDRIHKTLVSLNCIACHDRAGLGGPPAERRALFTSTQPSLGDQGRIPPPLTGVGAKLTTQALEGVLLRGERERDYVDASMPQFGEKQVAHLVELFGKVDQLEQAALPKVEQIVESKAAGYELVGTNGLGCVACHAFNGQKAGEISALDITRSPMRLKRNWFELYMRQPSRFHPTVIMPGFWPEGKSVRPNILNGDTAHQIEAIWNYLSDGERAKKPAGLSRQSSELRVGDSAEICRGRSSAAGYRGIGVGYPDRINLVFDSGEMSLRMLWKGEFANVDMGSFSPRGTNQVPLPPGIPFYRLKSPDENWPYKGKTNHAFPQDQGYEWRGYSLDSKRRPTFRYTYGEIAVQDFFEDVRGQDGKAFFRRTMVLTAPSGQDAIQFRAAAGKGVQKISEKEFQLESLRVRIVSEHSATARDGTPSEVLIPLTLQKGETKLVLEYLW